MLIGYLLGKADDADALAAHRQALHAVGCERVVEDLATASRWGQPELRALLDGLREGDVVVVPQLDCLGAALADVVRRIGRITAASAALRSLKEAIDTATDAGRAAARMVSSLSALDRGARRERIGAGLAAARAQGRRGGRRPKLTGQQRLLIAEEVLSRRSTAARMARLYKVSAPTISRITAEHRARTD